VPVSWIDASAAAAVVQPAVVPPPGYAAAPASGLRFVPAEAAMVAASRMERVAPLSGGAITPRATKVSTRARSDAEHAEALPVASSAPDQASESKGIERVSPSVSSIPQIGWGWSAALAVTADETARSRWSIALPGGSPNALLTALALTALFLSATAVAARQRRTTRKMAEVTDQRSDSDAVPVRPATEPADASPPPPPLPRTHREPDTASVPPQVASLRTRPPPVPKLQVSDWDSVVELGTTAAALLDIVQQIIDDHVPDSPLREVLAAELLGIAARLNGVELAAALGDGRLDRVQPVYTQAILDLERLRTLARIEHERSNIARSANPQLPGSFEEACEFLGVNPRAGAAVVKKVVDALRQNWHPDLAVDDADRATREERTKRINAAWDLVRSH